MYEDEEVGGKVKLKSIIGNNRKQLATFTTAAHFFPSLFLAGFTHLVDIHITWRGKRQFIRSDLPFKIPLETLMSRGLSHYYSRGPGRLAKAVPINPGI